MIAIKYVGNKKFCFDTVAHTGLTWNGKGTIQQVSAPQARQLLKYPDQWALANPADADNLDHTVAILTTDETGGDVTVEESDLKKPLEKMSRAELKVYAKVHFNKDLKVSMARTLMLNQVEEWEKELDKAPLAQSLAQQLCTVNTDTSTPAATASVASSTAPVETA